MAARSLKLVPEPKKKSSSPSFLAIKQEMEKSYGPIMRTIQPSDRRRIPTGPFTLDWNLGGGLPPNRLWLTTARKGCYKTTLALIMAAAYQMRCATCLLLKELCECTGGPVTREVVFIDAEHALDEDHAIRLGVDPTHFNLFRPPHGEAACEYTEKLSRAPEVGFVIMDSLATLVPEDHLETGYFDSVSRGLRARLIARMMRALINHIDTPGLPKFGIMLNHILPDQEGKGEILPGGETQKYLSSVVLKLWTVKKPRVMFTRGGDVSTKKGPYDKPDDSDMGGPRKQTVCYFLEHSKVSPDNVGGEFDIFIEDGPGVRWGDIDDMAAVINRATRAGIIESVPSGWVYDGKKYPTKKELVALLQSDRLLLSRFRDEVSRSILVYRKEGKEEEA